MSRWTGVVTNAGAELLNEWARGGRLRITGAASGDRTVPDAALLAQSDVSGTRRTAAVAGYRKINNGTQIRLQVSASQEEGYSLCQLGVWAALDGGTAILLALFQNREGVPIPSEEDSKDFVYTFYGAVVMDNTGNFEVHIDTSAIVSLETLRDAIDRLKLEIMTNTLTLPLTAADGEQLLTNGGTPLLAVYHPNQSAAVLAELAALEGRMSGRIAETAAGLAADCAAASMRDRAYADGRVLALERAVDGKLEAQAADTEEQIQTAKTEAVSAAGTDAAEKANAAKTGAISAASADAAEQDEVVKKKLIYRIANDIWKHTNDSSAHPEMLRTSQGYYAVPPDALLPPPEDVMDIFDAYI